MTSVTQQNDMPSEPARKRVTLYDRPFMDLGAGLEHVSDVGMEISESGAEDLDVPFGRP
jgi:hypothetical protein